MSTACLACRREGRSVCASFVGSLYSLKSRSICAACSHLESEHNGQELVEVVAAAVAADAGSFGRRSGSWLQRRSVTASGDVRAVRAGNRKQRRKQLIQRGVALGIIPSPPLDMHLRMEVFHKRMALACMMRHTQRLEEQTASPSGSGGVPPLSLESMGGAPDKSSAAPSHDGSAEGDASVVAVQSQDEQQSSSSLESSVSEIERKKPLRHKKKKLKGKRRSAKLKLLQQAGSAPGDGDATLAPASPALALKLKALVPTESPRRAIDVDASPTASPRVAGTKASSVPESGKGLLFGSSESPTGDTAALSPARKGSLRDLALFASSGDLPRHPTRSGNASPGSPAEAMRLRSSSLTQTTLPRPALAATTGQSTSNPASARAQGNTSARSPGNTPGRSPGNASARGSLKDLSIFASGDLQRYGRGGSDDDASDSAPSSGRGLGPTQQQQQPPMTPEEPASKKPSSTSLPEAASSSASPVGTPQAARKMPSSAALVDLLRGSSGDVPKVAEAGTRDTSRGFTEVTTPTRESSSGAKGLMKAVSKSYYQLKDSVRRRSSSVADRRSTRELNGLRSARVLCARPASYVLAADEALPPAPAQFEVFMTSSFPLCAELIQLILSDFVRLSDEQQERLLKALVEMLKANRCFHAFVAYVSEHEFKGDLTVWREQTVLTSVFSICCREAGALAYLDAIVLPFVEKVLASRRSELASLFDSFMQTLEGTMLQLPKSWQCVLGEAYRLCHDNRTLGTFFMLRFIIPYFSHPTHHADVPKSKVLIQTMTQALRAVACDTIKRDGFTDLEVSAIDLQCALMTGDFFYTAFLRGCDLIEEAQIVADVSSAEYSSLLASLADYVRGQLQRGELKLMDVTSSQLLRDLFGESQGDELAQEDL